MPPAWARSYFGARYLAASATDATDTASGYGRFTTVDPVYTWKENLVDPQRWNRYAYVRNNPLRHIDPDGRTPVDPWKPDTHEALTRQPSGAMAAKDAAIVVAGNRYVDRVLNQGNDPDHYVAGFEEEAEAQIKTRFSSAVELELVGNHPAALFVLGEGLHTLQDKFAHGALPKGSLADWAAHLPLVGSDPDNPAKHRKEFNEAGKATREYLRRFNEEVEKRRVEEQKK